MRADWREWSQNLLESIRNAARAGRLPFRDDRPATATDPRHSADVILAQGSLFARAGSSERIIVVGVSTGGVQALQQLLAGLPGEHARDRDGPAHAGRLHERVRQPAAQRSADRDGSGRGAAARAGSRRVEHS